MARNKKKRKCTSRPNMTIKQQGRLIHQFREEILNFCDKFGAREVMQTLKPIEFQFMYHARFRPISFRNVQGVIFEPGLIKDLNRVLNDKFLQQTFQFPGYEAAVPFADFFTHAWTILAWVLKRKQDFGVTPVEVDQAFKPLVDLMENPENPQKKLHIWLDTLAAEITLRPDLFSYFFVVEQENRIDPRPYLGFKITLDGGRSHTRKVVTDGRSREVFQVFGWQHGLPYKPTVKAEQFCNATLMQGMEFDIYIQKHAVHRLAERLDIFDEGILYMNIADSFLVGQFQPHGENQILMGYYFYGNLVGYLLTELVDGIALIRTFLFLTNDGTPEGKKLHRRLGISKKDKAYTGLDRLSTFVHGDLREDPQLLRILQQSNCSTLLNIDGQLSTYAKEKSVTMDAEKIKSYLAPVFPNKLKQAG